MTDAPPPSPLPQPGGNPEATDSRAGKENDGQPKKKVKSRQTRHYFGLPKSKWRDFGGWFVSIAWLWYELIDNHVLSEIVALCIGLTVAHILALSYFWKYFRRAISIFLFLEIGMGVVAWNNSRPPPTPHLTLSIGTAEFPELDLKLTNKNLLFPPIVTSGTGGTCGVLVMPDLNKRFTLRWLTSNDSPVEVDNGVVLVTLPAEWKCNPGPGWLNAWQDSVIGSVSTVTPGEFVTNNTQSWLYRLGGPVFPGNGEATPDIDITTTRTGVLVVGTGAKDFKMSRMWMQLIFGPVTRPTLTSGKVNGTGYVHTELPSGAPETNK